MTLMDHSSYLAISYINKDIKVKNLTWKIIQKEKGEQFQFTQVESYLKILV